MSRFLISLRKIEIEEERKLNINTLLPDDYEDEHGLELDAMSTSSGHGRGRPPSYTAANIPTISLDLHRDSPAEGDKENNYQLQSYMSW